MSFKKKKHHQVFFFSLKSKQIVKYLFSVSRLNHWMFLFCIRAGVAFIRDWCYQDWPGGKPQKTDPGSADDVHSLLCTQARRGRLWWRLKIWTLTSSTGLLESNTQQLWCWSDAREQSVHHPHCWMLNGTLFEMCETLCHIKETDALFLMETLDEASTSKH